MSTTFDATERLIDELQKAVKANVVTVDGRQLIDGDLALPPLPRSAEPLGVHSLSALVEYVNAQLDLNPDESHPFLVSVQSPTRVSVYQWLDENRQRESFLVAVAIVSTFQFGQWHSIEGFIIALQTQFAETDQLWAVIGVCSNLSDSAVFSFTDDGVTQRTSGKVGIAREAQIELPRIVELRPYSTFKDVDRQPDRKFLLRLKRDEGKPPQAALFEADGGLWQNTAIELIKSYLEGAIEKGKAIIIG